MVLGIGIPGVKVLRIEEFNVETKSTFQKIYEVVKDIPYGEVATYGQIASLAGNRRLAKIVGYALHVNPNPESIPCYRVVNAKGEVSKAFAFGGENRQRELLMQEGVIFREDGSVNLDHCRWNKQVF